MPKAILETVIAEVLEAEYSLSVDDDDGNLKGELPLSGIVDVLGSDEPERERQLA